MIHNFVVIFAGIASIWNLKTFAQLFKVLQSNQVKRTPQDSISELIIWKINPWVVPVTGVKFKVAFLHA